MRIKTEEWRSFIPGIRMYKGKKTLFYNGEILWSTRNGRPLIYNMDERQSWEVIIVLSGVEVIPEFNFVWCENVETVIMSDSVRRIEKSAFTCCPRLTFVRFSRSLEFIGKTAFSYCESLTSMFIPPSCRKIDDEAFKGCRNLIILSVSQRIRLGKRLIAETELIEASHFGTNCIGNYYGDNQEINDWIRHLNQGSEQFALHRECSSCTPPSADRVYEIAKERGLSSLATENEIGITVLKYLHENPFFETQIDEKKLMNRYILDLMGEFIA